MDFVLSFVFCLLSFVFCIYFLMDLFLQVEAMMCPPLAVCCFRSVGIPLIVCCWVVVAIVFCNKVGRTRWVILARLGTWFVVVGEADDGWVLERNYHTLFWRLVHRGCLDPAPRRVTLIDDAEIGFDIICEPGVLAGPRLVHAINYPGRCLGDLPASARSMVGYLHDSVNATVVESSLVREIQFTCLGVFAKFEVVCRIIRSVFYNNPRCWVSLGNSSSIFRWTRAAKKAKPSSNRST